MIIEVISSGVYTVFTITIVSINSYISYKRDKKEDKILKDFDERMKKLEEKLALISK